MTKIHVSTATPLSEAMHTEVEQWIEGRYGPHTTVYHVDAALIGGVVIFDGERVFDGSLKSRLDKLK